MMKSAQGQPPRRAGNKNAQEVLKEHWKNNPECPPVNVVAIARDEGIPVFKASFKNVFNDSVLGYIQKIGSKTEIVVNAQDAKTRQRFTIAHELGHYYLHHNGDMKYVDLRSGKTTPTEVEANKFASELLMPTNLVVREYDKLLFPTVAEMARIFDVSPAAMKIRLSTLGLDAC